MRLLNKNFFRFLFGFLAVIAVTLVLVRFFGSQVV